MPLNISKSTKGGNVLTYNGFQYILKRTELDGTKYWRCRLLNKCRCNAIVKSKYDDILEETNNHSHVGDEIQNRTNIMLSEIRERASTSRACTRDVIGRELVEANNGTLARMPRKSASEKRVQRVRKKAEVGIV